jgi:hypothetical protein
VGVVGLVAVAGVGDGVIRGGGADVAGDRVDGLPERIIRSMTTHTGTGVVSGDNLITVQVQIRPHRAGSARVDQHSASLLCDQLDQNQHETQEAEGEESDAYQQHGSRRCCLGALLKPWEHILRSSGCGGEPLPKSNQPGSTRAEEDREYEKDAHYRITSTSQTS